MYQFSGGNACEGTQISAQSALWQICTSGIKNAQEIVELEVPSHMKVADRVALDIALDHVTVSPA